jgi:hypothetical protein
MKKYPQDNVYGLTGIEGKKLQVGDNVVTTLTNKTSDLGFAEVIGFPPAEIEYSRDRKTNQRIPHDHFRVIIRRRSGNVAYISAYDTTTVNRILRLDILDN